MPKNIGWLCFCIAVIGHSAVAVSPTTTSPDAQTLIGSLKTLDDDKSGSVDANEIASFVESLIFLNDSKEGRLALAQAILAEYDTDGSGMIDAAEMVAPSTTAGGEKLPLATFVLNEIQRMDGVAKTGWAMFVVTAIILVVTFVGLQKPTSPLIHC